MSARVLNPAMMSELGHRGVGGTRVAPSRVALARVRRDLFGPVDHSAARALAERELRAQSILDAERWGFDFRLEIPRQNLRYQWEPITSEDVIPEPYALRGMPYLRKHAPGTPRKNEASSEPTRKRPSPIGPRKPERTPPQESRVPDNGHTELSDNPDDQLASPEICRRKKVKCIVAREPTTPVLKSTRKQTSITDFMKGRKRTLNGSAKSIVELPEKMARNAGPIRS